MSSEKPSSLLPVHSKAVPPRPPHKRRKSLAQTAYDSLQEDSVRERYTWLAVYFGLNLALTLYNKMVMGKFPYPYVLTGIHSLSGSIGCLIFYLRGRFTLSRLSDRDNLKLLLFSTLYTINIAISNVSLNLVTVPFHQVVRAMTPIFTMAIAIAFFSARYRAITYITLIPVVAGVGLATAGDYYFTALGFVLTLLGAFLAALKTIVTNKMQTGRGKLEAFELLYRMSPLAFVQTIIYAYFSGELSSLQTYARDSMTMGEVISLMINGALAFALNVVSFSANKKTGPLTMTVAANVKQILTIVLSIVLFNLKVTGINALGIFITLLGGAWYAKVELESKQMQQEEKAKRVVETVPLVEIKEER